MVTIRDGTPPELRGIKGTFQEIKDNQEEIIYEERSISASVSVKLKIDYVGDRWARGYATYYDVRGKEIQVPYTLSYVNLYVARYTANPPKVIRGSTNPIEEEDTEL